MPESFNATKWNGVSYIGKSARIDLVLFAVRPLCSAIPRLQGGTNRDKAKLRVTSLEHLDILIGAFGGPFRHRQAEGARQDFRQRCAVDMVCAAR